MFTGIIKKVLPIKRIFKYSNYHILVFEDEELSRELKLGDSVAIDGVCTTVKEISSLTWKVELGKETLNVTIGKYYKAGEKVNIEPAIKVGDKINGHFVTGHVDGIGKIKSIKTLSGKQKEIWIEFPEDLSKYITYKGSIAVNGISLTINEVKNNSFRINIISHTYKETTIPLWKSGKLLNLEIDLISRYLERFISKLQ